MTSCLPAKLTKKAITAACRISSRPKRARLSSSDRPLMPGSGTLPNNTWMQMSISSRMAMVSRCSPLLK
ncbi:hypothetical protein D3C80_1897040 [compost metagenome]